MIDTPYTPYLRTLKPFQNLKFPKTIEDITNRPVFMQVKRQ